MNGRVRIAFCGAAATALTATCLWPLVTPRTWLLQAVLILLVVTGAGLALRRPTVPRPLVPVVQLVIVLLMLTVLYVSGKAIGGVLPGRAAFQALSGLISGGISDSSRYSAPAPDHAGLRLLLVCSVVLIGLVVDVLVATYQRVALAGLPLLALYSVGTGLHPHGELWLWFLLSTGGYLALLMAEGHDRLSRWGRVFHGTPATLAGTTGGNPLSGTGYRIAGAAIAAGLLLPLALPSLGSGLIGQIGGSGNGIGAGGSNIITAVNPLASLATSLNQPTDSTVLTYTTNSPTSGDQYLRIVDLDDFNGVAWTTSSHTVQSVPVPLPEPTGLAGGTPQQQVKTKITTVHGYVQQWLPMPYPATAVTVDGKWKYEPEGRTLVGEPGQTAGGLAYTVDSLALRPTASQLRDSAAPPSDILKTYLTLPDNFPAVIHDDAVEVTRNAATPYDKAVALQDWFTTTGGFQYNTQVKGDTSANAMVDFLRNRQGFCVHFASTMAAMARSLGIPARVAIGFTPGTQQPDGSWNVGTKDAHAWPELYFSGVGWLRFEPTPTRGLTPDYTVATVPSGTAPASTATAGATAAAGPTSTAGTACVAQERRLGFCGTDDGAVSPGLDRSAGGPNALELAGIALAALLVLLLLTPMLWRLRARSRRLRRGTPPGSAPPGGGRGGGNGSDGIGGTGRNDAGTRSDTGPGVGRGDGSIELSERQVLAAWRELIDSAWDLGIPPDEAETPRRTAARIVTLGDLQEEPSAAAGRLALATEQVLYAPRMEAPVSLRQDVRTVRRGLRASARRSTRARAVLFPPSSARLARSLRLGLASAGRRIGRLLPRRSARDDSPGRNES